MVTLRKLCYCKQSNVNVPALILNLQAEIALCFIIQIYNIKLYAASWLAIKKIKTNPNQHKRTALLVIVPYHVRLTLINL